MEVPESIITNGDVDEAVITDGVTLETRVKTEDAVAPVAPVLDVVDTDEAVASRLVQHQCNTCDRVFMSMQGLRSHERSHLAAAAAISKQDKYSCHYCHFQSAFRHKYVPCPGCHARVITPQSVRLCHHTFCMGLLRELQVECGFRLCSGWIYPSPSCKNP